MGLGTDSIHVIYLICVTNLTINIAVYLYTTVTACLFALLLI
jgi:hypothetical protein